LKNSNFIDNKQTNFDNVLNKLDKIKDDTMRLQKQMDDCPISFWANRLDNSLNDIRHIFIDKKREH
jgi:GTP-binding protein EngB required for normal cell division